MLRPKRNSEKAGMAGTSGRAMPRRAGIAAMALSCLLAGVLSGCNSDRLTDVANQEVSHAALVIDLAKSQNAANYAPGEMAIAEEKLDAARQAVRNGNFDDADWRVSEALVNVELAQAKAEAARTKAELQRRGHAGGAASASDGRKAGAP